MPLFLSLLLLFLSLLQRPLQRSVGTPALCGPQTRPRGLGSPAEPHQGQQQGPICQQPAIPGVTDGGWGAGRCPYPPSITLSLSSAPGQCVCLESMCGTLPPWACSPHSPGTPAVPRGAQSVRGNTRLVDLTAPCGAEARITSRRLLRSAHSQQPHSKPVTRSFSVHSPPAPEHTGPPVPLSSQS